MACPGGAPWEWQSRGGPSSPVLTSDLHGWDVQAADSQSAKLLPSCSEMVTVAAHTLTRQFPCHGEKPPAFQLGLQAALGRERCQLESWKVTRLAEVSVILPASPSTCAVNVQCKATGAPLVLLQLHWPGAESSHALLTKSSMSSSC